MTHMTHFKNCLEVTSTGKGWRAQRFTPEQLQYYALTDGSRIRSICSSGAMLDIYSDTNFIEIEFLLGYCARTWWYFDIYVDDIFIESIGMDRIESQDGLLRFEIKSTKKHRISIYLPHLVELSILDIRYSDGSSVEPTSPEKNNLLCLGDSITQGMDCKYPSLTYPVLLSRFLGMNLLNQGVGGDLFDKSSLDPTLPYEPDLITVAYGTNDWGRYDSLLELRQRCSQYLQGLYTRYPAAKIVVITPLWRQDIEQGRPMGSFREMSQTIADACSGFSQIQMIDGLSLVPHQPRFFGDGKVHPNGEGFLHMTYGILKKLRKSLLWNSGANFMRD